MPKGIPGMHGRIKGYVQAHAAAIMRLEGHKKATLYLNRKPCNTPRLDGCEDYLPRMLPKNAQLNVVNPDGYRKTFIGLPD